MVTILFADMAGSTDRSISPDRKAARGTGFDLAFP